MNPPQRQRRILLFHLPKMLVCPGPFLLTVKLHHHLSPAIQVFSKGVWFGSWCFTDPSKFTFKTFIVFLVIIGEIFFCSSLDKQVHFSSKFLVDKNPVYEKSFSSFSFCNFALLSVHMLLWPFIFYLFPSSCSSFFPHYQWKASWVYLQRYY